MREVAVMNQIDKESPVRSEASINRVRRSISRRVRVVLLALIATSALLGSVAASSAMAAFSISSFSNQLTNQDGTPATLAGSHPYEDTVSLVFPTDSNGLPTANVKDVAVNLPPGLIGDPNATPKCEVQQLNNGACPPSSQVGQLILKVFLFSPPATNVVAPLYNIVPPAGMPAQFGSNILVVNSFLDVSVRTGSDYGLTTSSFNISADLPVVGITSVLWGVPADPSHDMVRGASCLGVSDPSTCVDSTPVPAGVPAKPFLTLPTTCSSDLTTTASADSWQSAGTFATATYHSQDSSGNPVGISGCGRLSFSPTISAQPDTKVADSPAGMDVDLHVPQAPDTPSALATPTLKSATVTLPKGMGLNAATANGLGFCSEKQFGLTNTNQPGCPNASKIGSVEIDSPIQADPLVGSVYLAEPLVNEAHSLLAMYVAAQSDGVLVKLVGAVMPNLSTGQLTVTFANNPPLPFSDFKLDFFSGPRSALATPESCGMFTTTSSLTPSSGGAAATPSDTFAITTGCATAFKPTFVAGARNPQAGAYSPFALSISRADTDQEFGGLSTTLPAGLLAKLGSVPLCASAAAKAGTCPAPSEVGTAEVGAGPGPDPFFLPGQVYLTGPYKGGAFGLAVVTHVHAGPLNLGTLVVRQSLRIDPTTAQVTVVSDPFPTILLGIPLRIRRIDVNLNRPNFTINPTSCDVMKVTGLLTSTAGKKASEASRFQVGGCSGLGFSPKLQMKLQGGTGSGAHPTLVTTLTQPVTSPIAQANLRSVQVTLPSVLGPDLKNVAHTCPMSVANKVHGGAVGCPKDSIVGTATAHSPLLSQPLTGKVYLVQGTSVLPGLLVPLRGQIAIDLRASTSVASGGSLVTTFNNIPDAAVSNLGLTFTGGPKGILVLNGNACTKALKAIGHMVGQSGKTENSQITVGTSCH
jgi:hypothetical protein